MTCKVREFAAPREPLVGYAGRRLVVQLDDFDVDVQLLEDRLLADYLGGRGLNVQYLYEHRDPGVDPLAPTNPLLFATGPFAGTLYPGGGRLNVTGPSPQTGLLGDSNAGGFWGPALKRCGFEQLVLTGSTEGPAVLALTLEEARLYRLPELAGLTIKETITALQDVLGPGDWQLLVAGPAAARGVRFAGVFVNGARAAARTGMGTLLASKGIKVIALNGKAAIGPHDPGRFHKLLEEMSEAIYEHPEHLLRTFVGTTKLMNSLNQLGALSTRHYTQGVFEDIDKVSGETLARRYKQRSKACHGCIVPCSRALDVNGASDELGSFKMEGPEFEGLAGFTSKLGISDLKWSLWAANYCNEQGIDVITASECLAATMECFERGIIDMEDTGGLQLNFGNIEAATELLRQVAEVRDFGARFVDGAVSGLASLGPEAARLVMHVKGLEIFQADPRGMKGYALGVAVASRGGDHLRSEPWLEFSGDEEEAERRLGVPEAAHRLETRGKGRLVKHFEEKAAVSDGLEVCKNTFNNMEIPDFDWAAEVYEAATGIPMDGEQLERAGERIVNLERLYNLAHGLRPGEDTLPARFTDEVLDVGESAGETVDIERLVHDYYEARDWSPSDGHPSRAKLRELGLEQEYERLLHHLADT